MDFAAPEEPKKPNKTVKEVVLEILEDEEEVDIDAIKVEIANSTKVKQLTDIYLAISKCSILTSSLKNY
jgi:hypothetical protein